MATVSIQFEDTAEDIRRAEDLLLRLRGGGSPTEASPGASTIPVPGTPAAIDIAWKHMTPGGLSRELLSVLPVGENAGLTPTELARLLPADKTGQPRTKAQVRAALRNIARAEAHLKANGLMEADQTIVQTSFKNYDTEGAGRYYLSPEDRQALDLLTVRQTI